MGRKVIYTCLALSILGSAVFAFLYFKGGLKQYIRATSLVDNLSLEKQEKGGLLFYGNTNGNEYGGIYAGTTKGFKPIVWVWGKNGLKPFATDRYSVFWHVKGCNIKLSPGNTTIRRERDGSVDDWKKQVRAGDHVMVVVTTETMGGTKGNLREVVGMDWWGFLQKGLEEECKK